MAPKYSCAAIDMRGFGNSTYKTPILSLYDLADDINSFLLEKNIENCILIGSSLGGAICELFSIKYPHMIKAIICLAPMPTLGFPTFRLENNKQTDQRIMNKDELNEHPSIKYIEKIIQENNIP